MTDSTMNENFKQWEKEINPVDEDALEEFKKRTFFYYAFFVLSSIIIISFLTTGNTSFFGLMLYFLQAGGVASLVSQVYSFVK